jgi:hypothetical protein
VPEEFPETLSVKDAAPVTNVLVLAAVPPDGVPEHCALTAWVTQQRHAINNSSRLFFIREIFLLKDCY